MINAIDRFELDRGVDLAAYAIPVSLAYAGLAGLPPQVGEIATLRDGIVLVTGSRGSGKSSTLATLLDSINQQQTCHVITIEDPIEFLHNHKRATIHQRELHSDTPSFAMALRAALRQAPKVILIGEMRDRETMEMILEAAETGHLVFSTLHTNCAVQTINRVIDVFPPHQQKQIRLQLAAVLKAVVSLRLLPRADGLGRVPAAEGVRRNPGRRLTRGLLSTSLR